LLEDTSPALQGITTTKTTPPTPDIAKLQLRKTDRQRDSSGEACNSKTGTQSKKERDRGKEGGGKNVREEGILFPPVRKKENIGT